MESEPAASNVRVEGEGKTGTGVAQASVPAGRPVSVTRSEDPRYGPPPFLVLILLLILILVLLLLLLLLLLLVLRLRPGPPASDDPTASMPSPLPRSDVA